MLHPDKTATGALVFPPAPSCAASRPRQGHLELGQRFGAPQSPEPSSAASLSSWHGAAAEPRCRAAPRSARLAQDAEQGREGGGDMKVEDQE